MTIPLIDWIEGTPQSTNGYTGVFSGSSHHTLFTSQHTRHSIACLSMEQTPSGATQMAGSIGQVLNFSCPNSPTHSCAFPMQCDDLLVVLLSLVVDDVEELKLVDASGGRDNTEPVTELLLLEELLGPASTTVSIIAFRSLPL